MPDITTVVGDKVIFKFGDGADPEVFTAKCMVNLDRSLSFNNNLTETKVPNCDDPTLPDKIVYRVESQSVDGAGAGVMNIDDLPYFHAWYKSGEAKNVQVDIGDAAESGQTLAAACILTNFSVTGTHKEETSFDATFQFTGDDTLTAMV